MTSSIFPSRPQLLQSSKKTLDTQPFSNIVLIKIVTSLEMEQLQSTVPSFVNSSTELHFRQNTRSTRLFLNQELPHQQGNLQAISTELTEEHKQLNIMISRLLFRNNIVICQEIIQFGREFALQKATRESYLLRLLAIRQEKFTSTTRPIKKTLLLLFWPIDSAIVFKFDVTVIMNRQFKMQTFSTRRRRDDRLGLGRV